MKDYEVPDEFWSQVGGKTRYAVLTSTMSDSLNKVYGSILLLARSRERISTTEVVKAYRVLLSTFTGEDSPLAALEAFDAFVSALDKDQASRPLSAETISSLENVKERFADTFKLLKGRPRHEELVANHFRVLLHVFMNDRELSAVDRLDMRDVLVHGILSPQDRPLLVTLLNTRDALAFSDDLEPLEPYVEAVKAFQRACPREGYPDLEEFRNSLWVEGLWRAQALLT